MCVCEGVRARACTYALMEPMFVFLMSACPPPPSVPSLHPHRLPQ